MLPVRVHASCLVATSSACLLRCEWQMYMGSCTWGAGCTHHRRGESDKRLLGVQEKTKKLTRLREEEFPALTQETFAYSRRSIKRLEAPEDKTREDDDDVKQRCRF